MQEVVVIGGQKGLMPNNGGGTHVVVGGKKGYEVGSMVGKQVGVPVIGTLVPQPVGIQGTVLVVVVVVVGGVGVVEIGEQNGHGVMVLGCTVL